jgi:signal transduction histidine kinase
MDRLSARSFEFENPTAKLFDVAADPAESQLMTWITILWPMVTGACVTMAVIQLRIGLRQSPGAAHLLFSLNAFLVAVTSCLELASTRAATPAQFLEIQRWLDFTGAAVLVSLTAFVWVFLGTGRKWLVFLGPVLTCVSLVGNLLPVPRAAFLQITGLRTVQTFGGATYTVPEGVRTTWPVVLFYSGMFLMLVFVADASITLWRQGARRRAAVVGGAITFFLLGAGVQCTLVDAGILRTPYLFSFTYLAILVAMGMELSADVLRAAQLARDLRESEQRMVLAVRAAELGLWAWDITRDEIWATDKGRLLFGFGKSERIDFERFADLLHPDDREPVNLAVAKSFNGDGDYESEYRLIIPGQSLRWIAARGSVEFNNAGKPVFMRGVSLDITQRKQAELEIGQQRNELAHLSRVTTVSALSGSLAHELNQPLAIILTNAQAAQRLLAQSPPDLAEAQEILTDIVSEDQRAGEVIRRLRALLKQEEPSLQPLSVNEIIEDVLRMARSDLIARGVAVHRAVTEGAPKVLGDRIQLQQVLLNLILNGCDAMAANPSDGRRLTLATMHRNGTVHVSVSDTGCGLPPATERVFESFYTTKNHGLGLGLSICRSIITAHKGRLWAENNATSGAVFHVELPASEGQITDRID